MTSSLIYVPHRKLWKPDPIEIPYRLRGMFRLQVLGPDKKLRKDTGWFPNLITNQGLDYLGQNNQSYTRYCSVGTGNSAPAVTDTTLNAFVANVANNGGQSPANGTAGTNPNYYGYINFGYNFGQGVAAGNLQEIGIGPDGTNLFSRALILNSMGAPTTLTILSNEYLNASYQLQLYNPTSDVSGSVTVAGTVCNYTLRAANAGNSGWLLGGFNAYPETPGLHSMQIYSDTSLQPITGAPIGTLQANASGGTSVGGYTNGTYYIDGTSTFNFGDGNNGANNSALCVFGRAVGQFGNCQIIFGATIPKTSSQIMTLTMRQSWGRYP